MEFRFRTEALQMRNSTVRQMLMKFHQSKQLKNGGIDGSTIGITEGSGSNTGC